MRLGALFQLLRELFIELACERHETLRLIELALFAAIGFLRVRAARACAAALLQIVGQFECLGLFQLKFVYAMLQGRGLRSGAVLYGTRRPR